MEIKRDLTGAATGRATTGRGRRLARLLWACGTSLVLWGCGGGGGGGGGSADPAAETAGEACSVRDQQNWVRNFFRDTYLWSGLSPDASPVGFQDLRSYYRALLFTGNGTFPADRYSGFSTTASFTLFYGEGRSMGYGVSVAGVEVTGRPDLPLYVRYVEPQSPAFAAGIRRGDEVISLNGRSAAELIELNDFSALSPSAEGEVLQLQLRSGSRLRTATVTAAVFNLTPVQGGTIIRSPRGRSLGYVYVHNMISQTDAALQAAFAEFRFQGIDSVVLDLRYNGGGLVSVGGRLASYAAGRPAEGRVYADLVYNTQQSANNSTFRFSNPALWDGVRTVYVLTGSRTCSASEQVINGLRGVGVNAVTIGDSTCGKPVGFLPRDYCGFTHSIVNFESLNAVREGRYFNGFSATCRVAESFTQPLGQANEPLLAAALRHADTGTCPAVAQDPTDRQVQSVIRRAMPAAVEPGEWQGMIPR